jgi:hypothetical protein
VRGLRDWIAYRLLGRCWAQGCSRPMVLHTARQRRCCEHTPLAIELTEQGWRHGVEPEPISKTS